MRAVAALPAERAIRVVEHSEPRIERVTDVVLEILEVGVAGGTRLLAQRSSGIKTVVSVAESP